MDAEIAVAELDAALSSLFVPNHQAVEIAARAMGMAQAHHVRYYSDPANFARGVFATKSPLSPGRVPVCLTGLAGVGKSSLLSRIVALMPAPCEVRVPQYSKYVIEAVWHYRVRGRPTLAQCYLDLLCPEDEGKNRYNARVLDELVRKRAYRHGVSMLVADELQFLTRSARANVLATTFVLALADIGVPFIYGANYSLVRRLLARPQEDIDRLLAHPIVLMPPASDSAEWRELLAQYTATLPGVLRIGREGDVEKIHFLTAGLPRKLKSLVLTAFRRMRSAGEKWIDLVALERAYESEEFSTNRTEVVEINQALLTGNTRRRDLLCPLDLPKLSTALAREAAVRARKEEMARKLAFATQPKVERDRVAGPAPKEKRGASGGRSRRRAAPTLDEFRGTEELLSGASTRGDGS